MDGKKNWSKLPDDITMEIASQLRGEVDDLVRFGAVCRSWNSMSVDVCSRYPLTSSPWLMLPEKEDDDGAGVITTQKEEVRKFYCVSTKRTFHMYLPEAVGKRCYGSHLGWLLTIDVDGNINLLNPLNRSHVPLPSRLTFQCQYYTRQARHFMRLSLVTRFAMSSNNVYDPNCICMVIYSQHCSIAFVRPGDQSWTHVSGPDNKKPQEDVIFFKGKFYSISAMGMLRLCDIDNPHPKLVDIIFKPDDVDEAGYNYFLYLVEMCGDLHLVVRYYDQDENAPKDVIRYVAKLFEVYKLDFESIKWIEVFDLEEYAIFVGNHTSFAISTLDHPHLKPNSIYFTDDQYECYPHGFYECWDGKEYVDGDGGGGRDMGIFDFCEETIEPFYPDWDIISTFCPPLFFTPSLT